LNTILMKNSKIAILVYDITDKKSFNELSYWYNQIINTNDKDDIIIGVAGNKSDRYEEQVVPTEEGQKYADKINAIFRETSAKDHESIEILFNEILKVFIEKEKIKIMIKKKRVKLNKKLVLI
jgi:Ras-related protein Rab-6A